MNTIAKRVESVAEERKRIEEIKFEYIEAECNNNTEEMETLMNKLYVMEAFYNHHTAIVNGDAENNGVYSQEDHLIENMQAKQY